MFKKGLYELAKFTAENFDTFLISTYIAGVGLSSLAQTAAIKHNNKYSNSEKKFMIKQEWSDAGINSGLFAIITVPLGKLASELVETGRFITDDCRNFISTHAPEKINDLGKYETSITKILKKLKFKNVKPQDIENMIKKCTTVKNSMATCAVVGGGILASCVLSPIVRNIVASHRHENSTTIKPQTSNTPVLNPNPQNKPNTEVKPNIETKPHRFDDFRTRTTGMKI